MPLQLPAQALQLAAGQDGLAVLALQVILLLHQLALLLLQDLHLLLRVTVLLQLGERGAEAVGAAGQGCALLRGQQLAVPPGTGAL